MLMIHQLLRENIAASTTIESARGPMDFDRKSERRPPVPPIIYLVPLATVFASIPHSLEEKIHVLGLSCFRRPTCPVLCLEGILVPLHGWLDKYISLRGVMLRGKILGKGRFNYQVGW